jgi:hypothetical protein
MMHGSRLPLRVWFWGAHLVAINADLVPVRRFQKLLGISYKAAWELRRTLLSLRREGEDAEQSEGLDLIEPLEGLVEVNRTELSSHFYNTISSRLDRRTVVIAAAVEAVPVYENTSFQQGRIRLTTLSDNSAASIEAFVRANVKPGATLLTDGHRSYRGLTGYHLDTRRHGNRPPFTERVLTRMKAWLKIDISDLDAVNRGLKHFQAEFTPVRGVTYENLLRSALRRGQG